MIYSMINNLVSNFPIPKKVVNDADGYLFHVDDWDFYELFVFSQTTHCLSLLLTCLVAKEMLIKALLNVAEYCIREDNLETVNYFIENAELVMLEMEFKDTFYEYCFLDCLYGFYLLMMNNEMGPMKMMKELSQLSLIESYLRKYIMHYNKAIELSYEKRR